MKERKRISYSLGLRLWEIYNRRVIETATTGAACHHYDLFFKTQNRCSELRISLVCRVAKKRGDVVKKRRRHTHFTVSTRLMPASLGSDRRLSLCRSIAERLEYRGACDSSSGREINGAGFASRNREPTECFCSRQDGPNRRSLPRAPCTSRSAPQGASRGTRHTSFSNRRAPQGSSRGTRSAPQGAS